jgi:hypothetical protein
VGYVWMVALMQYPAVMCFFLFRDTVLRFKAWVITTKNKLKGKSCKEILTFKWLKDKKTPDEIQDKKSDTAVPVKTKPNT